ncbi:ATP-binding protein [Streptomyces sp. NPDC058417]|uniref:ATP-binding protein n=1 Tax=unclassified Streptomyces TaxID=2593676 RepID=UPI00364A0B22
MLIAEEASGMVVAGACAVVGRRQFVLGVVPGLSALGEVRRSVQSWLAGSSAAACADDACLVVHELVANAVEHGGAVEGSWVEVSLDVDPGAGLLRVSVWDGGGVFTVTEPERTAAAAAVVDGERGRGLAMVSALSRAWGVQEVSSGKRVWATLGLSDH